MRSDGEDDNGVNPTGIVTGSPKFRLVIASAVAAFRRPASSLTGRRRRRGKSGLSRQCSVHPWPLFPVLSQREYKTMSFPMPIAISSLAIQGSVTYKLFGLQRWQPVRFRSNALVTLDTDDNVARFLLKEPSARPRAQTKGTKKPKRQKMSRKAKLNELKWYRLKAKKKLKSPNPEVRIRYKLEKAKRKEEWLIEKLRKYEIPKAPGPEHDPEILTEEERFYLKRTGEKKKNYVPVGRRGVFGGVVLNMHLHWKKHETVKVVCKPCRPGQVHEYAEELARLSKGTVIDIKPNNIIIFYRGKNYVQPEVMSPPDTLSKQKALEKYRFEQSLEHTSQHIEKLEKELEEYQKHVALYKKREETTTGNSMDSN
ncbi:putative CRM domain-containing protein, chloroplastic [Cocos nucifera]|uniref:Putative CRM domain-containing protein, chloroplastic n=1 Tax=Cocos nucifera TaxID=13894 RepID=A0A8K0HVY0_COCNU|nr:putative CRM domain-containing protein, chloroplastic [Cocos nucifera]